MLHPSKILGEGWIMKWQSSLIPVAWLGVIIKCELLCREPWEKPSVSGKTSFSEEYFRGPTKMVQFLLNSEENKLLESNIF